MTQLRIKLSLPASKQIGFVVKNFASFITITLIIARKTITAVFGTMVLQLAEAFRCAVWTIQWNKQARFFDCCNAFIYPVSMFLFGLATFLFIYFTSVLASVAAGTEV